MEIYTKKGYLNSEFRLFHLTDRETQEVAYHYHDFDKITIFIKGSVSYMIEGKSYDLKPYDIVLVGMAISTGSRRIIRRCTHGSSSISHRILWTPTTRIPMT